MPHVQHIVSKVHACLSVGPRGKHECPGPQGTQAQPGPDGLWDPYSVPVVALASTRLLHSAERLFLQTFWQTMVREWPGIDRLRLDKFYLVRRSRPCLGPEGVRAASPTSGDTHPLLHEAHADGAERVPAGREDARLGRKVSTHWSACLPEWGPVVPSTSLSTRGPKTHGDPCPMGQCQVSWWPCSACPG